MTVAALNSFLDIEDDKSSLWRVALVVALIHLLFIAIGKYGFPELFPKKTSEITIELGGSLMRGAGGVGIPAPVTTPTREEPKRSAAQDELATKRTSDVPKSNSQPVTSSPPAGVESAPTIDADYKAAYLNNPKPPYPSVAFQMRIEGTAMLKALVLPDGSCSEVVLVKTSGNSMLDDSALKTVAQWKFTPAKSQGKEVSQWVSIPIIFSIKRR
jgi:protein TonB